MPKFKQICVGQYTRTAGRDNGMSYVVIGLTEEGAVYQFKSGRWQPIEEGYGARKQEPEEKF